MLPCQPKQLPQQKVASQSSRRAIAFAFMFANHIHLNCFGASPTSRARPASISAVKLYPHFGAPAHPTQNKQPLVAGPLFTRSFSFPFANDAPRALATPCDFAFWLPATPEARESSRSSPLPKSHHQSTLFPKSTPAWGSTPKQLATLSCMARAPCEIRNQPARVGLPNSS